jgi:hypothetical protein
MQPSGMVCLFKPCDQLPPKFQTPMHSTASSQPVAFRLKSLALVAVLLPGASAEAGGLVPGLERVGRYFGVGYSDGYHVCKPDYDSPCADLPIRRKQDSCLGLDVIGNHGQNECDACGLRTEIVECEGGSCFTPLRSRSDCDQPSCDDASCDGPACYATAPFPAYASRDSKVLPSQTVSSDGAPVTSPELSPTQFIQTQVATTSGVAEKTQSIAVSQSADAVSQVSIKRSRMIRPSEVTQETASPEPAQKDLPSPKRRPKRL